MVTASHAPGALPAVTRACFIIVVLSGLLGLAGCRSAPACPAQMRTDPQKALADHEIGQSGWRSIKAEARVTQWGRDGRVRGTVLMFLERPNRVRFDVMSQAGPVAVLTSDGETFQLSDLRERVFLSGPTCAQNLARLLGISVDASDVLRLLTGDTPLIEAVEQRIECRGGSYVVTLVSSDGETQELSFSVNEADRDAPPDEQRLTLRRSTLHAPDGAKRWEATYDEYIEVDGHFFPTEVRFVDEVNDADTSVRVKSISLDPDVPNEAFQQAPRPGMTIEIAPCS